METHTIETQVLRLVPEPRAMTAFSRVLAVSFVLILSALIIVPWQQSAPGKGRVIAYAPVERQQTIEAPLDGRIVRWFVREGDLVKAGEPLVDVMDNDPDFLERLEAEREAVRARLTAAEARVTAIENRVTSLRSSQRAAIAAADHRTAMARDRLEAAGRAVEAAEGALKAAHLNWERQSRLHEQGLASRRTVEVAEADEVRARTDVERAKATLSAARAEVAAVSADQNKVGDDAFASINDALAARAASESEIASAKAELARMNTRISRQEMQHVRAPADGAVLRIVARQGGEYVKAGETLLTFVPDTRDRAVELWIPGNDVNLVRKGQEVRLQFEGWPAVQFSGWPSLAIGTYGGRVAFVDPTDDGQGKFRVVVVSDGDEAPWPTPEYLRQGTRANGWILLNQVRLGYEVWRQFNGFPAEWTASESMEPTTGGKGGSK